MNPYVNIGVGIDTSLPFIFSQKCALLRPSSWMIKLNFIKTLPHCSLLYQFSTVAWRERGQWAYDNTITFLISVYNRCWGWELFHLSNHGLSCSYLVSKYSIMNLFGSSAFQTKATTSKLLVLIKSLVIRIIIWLRQWSALLVQCTRVQCLFPKFQTPW